MSLSSSSVRTVRAADLIGYPDDGPKLKVHVEKDGATVLQTFSHAEEAPSEDRRSLGVYIYTYEETDGAALVNPLGFVATDTEITVSDG